MFNTLRIIYHDGIVFNTVQVSQRGVCQTYLTMKNRCNSLDIYTSVFVARAFSGCDTTSKNFDVHKKSSVF